MQKLKLIKPVALTLLFTASITAYAANNNFTCPTPAEIQSTDFTAPSIWLAPPMPHSVPGQVGVGLGGKTVKEYLGVEAATVSNKKGWVCVYKSEGGDSTRDLEAKIREIVGSNKYLSKYLEKVNKIFEDAEPYLKRYPQDEPVGFVGYQENNLK